MSAAVTATSTTAAAASLAVRQGSRAGAWRRSTIGSTRGSIRAEMPLHRSRSGVSSGSDAAAAALLIAATAVVTRSIVLKTKPSGQSDVATGGVPGTKPTPGKLVDNQQKLILTYDEEILRLDSAVTERRSQLDTNTVKIIEKNLKVIDKAIAESRAALEKDPHSHFLNDQLARVLDQKVGLLRTVALLPART